MSIFLDESEISYVVSKAIDETNRVGPNTHSVLVPAVTKAVTNLLELKALQAVAEAAAEQGNAEASATNAYDDYSQTAVQQIRSDAYSIAQRHTTNDRPDELHSLAKAISEHIEAGFTPANTKILTAMIKPELSGFQEAIDAIFGRTEWRREGWNDARSVMIRKINEQIKNRFNDSYVLQPFKTPQLKIIRDFIGSFKFDETKP